MTIIVEGKNSHFFGAQAFVVDDSKDTASDWASKHIITNPAIKWILGRFVEADNPNSNNQMWSLEDLRMSEPSIQHSPMNLLHQPRNIVGAFVGTELLYPTQESASGDPANPFIEALGAFWRAYFPEEMELVQRAHDEGSLFFSMECVSETVTFTNPEGASETFPYRGPSDESYAGWDARGNIRQLNKPHFMGGALILPPLSPGWANAEVKSLSALVSEHQEQADRIYKEVKDTAGHLSEADLENITLGLLGKGVDMSEYSIKDGNVSKSDMQGENPADNTSSDLDEGGDEVSKTYTEEEFNAVSQELAQIREELVELQGRAANEAVEQRIAELTEKHEEEVASLKAELDTKILEAKNAVDELEAFKAEKAKEAEEWVAAAEAASRREERVARVAEVASFPEDHIEARADAWAEMSDDAFEALVADFAATAKKAEVAGEETEVPSETAMQTERETAAKNEGSAVTSVLRKKAAGIDPRTV